MVDAEAVLFCSVASYCWYWLVWMLTYSVWLHMQHCTDIVQYTAGNCNAVQYLVQQPQRVRIKAQSRCSPVYGSTELIAVQCIALHVTALFCKPSCTTLKYSPHWTWTRQMYTDIQYCIYRTDIHSTVRRAALLQFYVVIYRLLGTFLHSGTVPSLAMHR